MDIHIFLTVVLPVILLFTWYYLSSKLHQGMPPGPVGLPIVGYLPFLGLKPYKTFAKLVKKYGPIYSVKMGSRKVVVLNGCQVIREAFVKKGRQFAGRPHWMLSKLNGGRGIANHQPTTHWREIRKFSSNILRTFGDRHSKMEAKINQEVSYFMQDLHKASSQPADLRHAVQKMVSNVICSICFGERFQYGDQQFKNLIHHVDVFFQNIDSKSATNFLPFLWYLPMKANTAVDDTYKLIMQFVEERIESHLKTYDPEEPRDFIDLFIKANAESQPRENGGVEEVQALYNLNDLKYIVIDLFFGGTETVIAAIMWSLVYMLVFPDVQRKVQDELDNVVGRDKSVTLSDKKDLPYTQAVIKEILRMCNVIPMVIPHETTEDISLCGYNLPKGTTIFGNLYSVHMDEDEWSEPHEFRPERFLELDGKGSVINDAFMPYSAGRRNCLGEHLAKMEIFLFFTSILQQFNLEADKTVPSLDGRHGITHMPHQFKLTATAR
ncbi:cytochrome P450 2F5-like [Anneissia japonica]|uniref:cytochrome P450 2F5-like n=1 Tax=Anneissia japonica TaxID=1529436 RepID=UPI0014259540|nr:cytochrome P450 2F5-like [Anneissia japonica]